MPNLMDLPTELHFQITREVLYEAVRSHFRVSGRSYIFSTVEVLRSLSPYWTKLTDQLCSYEIYQGRKRLEAIRKQDRAMPGQEVSFPYFVRNLYHENMVQLVKDARNGPR